MRRAGAVDTCTLRNGGKASLTASRRSTDVAATPAKKKGFGAPAAKPAPADPKKVNKNEEKLHKSSSIGAQSFKWRRL